MANLNFQQPPRSIANQNLRGGGFSTSSLSGHVTPTSGMFPGSTGLTSSFTPQQLSPNRNLQMGNRLFGSGQRAFPDRRTIPGLGVSSSNPVGSMPSFGIPQGRYGSQGTISNFHTVFGVGGGGETSTPPLLDLSEFPSLTNRAGQGDSMPQPSPMPGKQPYDTEAQDPLEGIIVEVESISEDEIETSGSERHSSDSGTDGDVEGDGGDDDDNEETNNDQSDMMVLCEVWGFVELLVAVGMVKQPTAEASEFTMSSEDFPALPGTQSTDGPSPGGSVSGDKGISGGVGSELGSQESTPTNRAPGAEKSQAAKRGIQTSPDGKVTHIPASMVKDQFGMVGLLTFIRAAETDPNLVSLALGQDLTALGLNLNSPENLYPNFGGPWAETPCRPQDIDFHVPPEYLINANIREKLAPVKLNRYKDDLLFYMFYTNVGDILQLAAAAELYSREWRYHTEEKVWITQAPGLGAVEKTSTYERGTYYFFDAQNWRKVAKEFHLDYNKLEGRPQLPSIVPPQPV